MKSAHWKIALSIAAITGVTCFAGSCHYLDRPVLEPSQDPVAREIGNQQVALTINRQIPGTLQRDSFRVVCQERHNHAVGSDPSYPRICQVRNVQVSIRVNRQSIGGMESCFGRRALVPSEARYAIANQG